MPSVHRQHHTFSRVKRFFALSSNIFWRSSALSHSMFSTTGFRSSPGRPVCGLMAEPEPRRVGAEQAIIDPNHADQQFDRLLRIEHRIEIEFAETIVEGLIVAGLVSYVGAAQGATDPPDRAPSRRHGR